MSVGLTQKPNESVGGEATPNARRAQVHWATLSDGQGGGIRVRGRTPFGLTVRSWTAEALDRARHPTDLVADGGSGSRSRRAQRDRVGLMRPGTAARIPAASRPGPTRPGTGGALSATPSRAASYRDRSQKQTRAPALARTGWDADICEVTADTGSLETISQRSLDRDRPGIESVNAHREPVVPTQRIQEAR
jgi:hypothetical protein